MSKMSNYILQSHTTAFHTTTVYRATMSCLVSSELTRCGLPAPSIDLKHAVSSCNTAGDMVLCDRSLRLDFFLDFFLLALRERLS